MFAAIGTLHGLRHGWGFGAIIAWAMSAGFAVASLFRPTVLKRIYMTANVIAAPIGSVVSIVVMAAIFFGVLTPMAILRRLTRQAGDAWTIDRAAFTYWKRRPTPPASDRYLRQ